MKIRIRILLLYRQCHSLTKIKLLFNLNIKKITIIRLNKLKTLVFPLLTFYINTYMMEFVKIFQYLIENHKDIG